MAEINKVKLENKIKYEFCTDQLELPSRIRNCLKKSNMHTLLDFLKNNQEDLILIQIIT